MLLLFVAACLGHIVLMVSSHNWFYGLPLPHWVTDGIHLLHGLLVLAFPPLLWWNLSCLFDFATFGGAVLSAYVILCLAAALVALPFVTVMRLTRPKPRALGKVQSEIVDIVKQLGGPSAGVGRKRWRGSRPGMKRGRSNTWNGPCVCRVCRPRGTG